MVIRYGGSPIRKDTDVNAPLPHVSSPDDPAGGLKMLRQCFPSVITWFGAATGHWWALADDHLIEAATPTELARMLHSAELEAQVSEPKDRRTDSLDLRLSLGPSKPTGTMGRPTTMYASTTRREASRTPTSGAHRRQRRRVSTASASKAPRRLIGSWMPPSTVMAY
jgi:hypothetical protein